MDMTIHGERCGLCSHFGNCNLIGVSFDVIKKHAKLSIVDDFYMYCVKYFILKC